MRLAAIALSLCLASCGSPQSPSADASNRPKSPAGSSAASSAAAPATPCEVAERERARIPGLQDEGRLDRIVRVIRRADELCPTTARESWVPRLAALSELGRDAEAAKLATEIAADEKAPPEAQSAARKVLDPSAQQKDPRSARELYLAGTAARSKGKRAEMQRLYDRAIVAAEQETGKPLVLEPPFGDDHETPRARARADGILLATALGHGVSIRDKRVGRAEVIRLEGPGDDVSDLVFLDDVRLAAVAKDSSVWIWDVDTGRVLRHWVHPSDGGTAASPSKEELDAMALSPDGTLLATATTTGASGGTIRLWDVAKGEEVRRLSGFRDGTSRITFSADGKTILTETSTEGVRRWEARTGKLLPFKSVPIPDPSPPLSREALEAWGDSRPRTDVSPNLRLAVSPDGKKIATGSHDHSVRMWSVGKRKEMRILGVHAQTVSDLAFSPDGQLLASCAGDGVFLWNTPSSELARKLASGCGALAFSPEGKRLSVASGHGVRVSSVDGAGKESMLDAPGPASVSDVGFSPDGSLVAGASSTGLRLWDVASGSTKLDLPSGRFAFAPDGLRIAVATSRSALLLDVATGREVRHFDKIDGGSVPIAISRDWLAAGTDGPAVRLWELASGRMHELSGDSEAYGIAFLPHGRTVVTSDRALHFHSVTGEPIVTVVAMSREPASYALFAGPTPHVELLGLRLDVAHAGFVCRIGERSFPFEVCSERFLVDGMFAKVLAGEPVVIEP